jgi:hypothetical protein
MRVLDLFSGTGSATQAFKDKGHTVIRVELDPKFEAELTADVRDIDLSRVGSFDYIWASPPCTSFSVGSFRHHWKATTPCSHCGNTLTRVSGEKWEGCDTPKPGQMSYEPKSDTGRLGRDLLRKTLEIIQVAQPRWFAIENPRALMRKMPEVSHLTRHTITHCQYGDPRRMKPTDLFGVLPSSFDVRCCINGDPCHEAAPRGARTGTQGLNKRDSAMLPPMLGIELEDAMAKERT